MLTKAELKYYSSLRNKKIRVEENKFLVEGPKLITEALNFRFTCEIFLYTHSFEEEYRKTKPEFFSKSIRLECLKSLEFQKLTDTKSPQEIVGVFSAKKNVDTPEKQKIIVALENINDPGNLGSIIRNCDWFGIKSIMLSHDCAEVFNPKVIRASAGSVFHLTINRIQDFYSELNKAKEDGYKILCADLEGENIYGRKWEEKTIFIFANEANGPTDKLLNLVDVTVTIPKLGNAESLNVSNACAVILSEATKT